MIVRDEAALLPDCLASLSPLVDDIVVCDTGSTDDTIDLARRAGATVLERAWRDDFAWARNEALDACRHAEFVLWIDADERLVVDDPAAVRRRLQALSKDTGALEVPLRNRRGDRPDSSAAAVRVFRPQHARFDGALHERVVDEDLMLVPAVEFDGLSIDHVGYDRTRGDIAAKQQRNLDIARRQFSDRGDAKAALDLARSLAYAEAPVAEVLAAVEEGLALAAAGSEERLGMLSLAADFELQRGGHEAAAAAARQVLAVHPGSDVAAAVLAKVSPVLGLDDEVLALARTLSEPTARPTTSHNVALVEAAATAACLRRDDAMGAAEHAARVPLHTVDDATAVAVLVEACHGLPPARVAPVLTRVGGRDTAQLLRDIKAGGETADRPSPTPDADEQPMGITLDFADLGPAVAADDVSGAIPPWRRVLDLSGDPGLADQLEAAGHRVTTIEPNADLAAELLGPAGRFDRAIVQAGQAEALAPAIRPLLDPSGGLLIWDPDGGDLAPALHGYMTESAGPGLALARPTWDADVLDSAPHDVVATVIAVSDTALPDEMRLALRASLPDEVAIDFCIHGDLDQLAESDGADTLVFLLPSGVLPEPGWVQALWDETRQSGAPTGARLVDRAGRLLHAGVVDGRPVGRGEVASTPLFASDRLDAELAEPLVVPLKALGDEPIHGRLAAEAVALSLTDEAGPPAGPSLRNVFGDTVVLLGGPAPGSEHPEQRDPLERLFDRLLELEITPVYQPAGHAAADPIAEAAWRRRGVVVIPGRPAGVGRGLLRPDPIRPQPPALLNALEPRCVVYMTAEALGSDFRGAGRAAAATVVFTGLHGIDDARERADVVCDLAELPERIDDLLAHHLSPTPAAIPVITPIDHQPGMTSIVIPVWNRWDLTRACLDSVRKHTSSPYEVIIVDNGSTDATAEGLSRMASTAGLDLRVVTNAENRGFPAAVNQGIAASRGEFVCVLNNDTQVTHGWLDALVEALGLPDTVLVGPRTNVIGGLQRVPDALGPDDGKAAHRWARDFTKARAAQSWIIDRLVGFCLLGRRATFEEAGGFDEGFGIGNFEDDDLGMRLRAAGGVLRVVDDAFVLHHGSATFAALGIDHEASLHSAARHLDDRRSQLPVPITALVLSDGDAVAAAGTAASALLVADRVVVLERRAIASTELAVKILASGTIDVVALDWAADSGAIEALHHAGAASVLILEAGERLDVPDWGAARAEIERLAGRPVALEVPHGSEVRIVPATPEAIVHVGGQAAVRLATCAVTRPG